MGCSVQYWLLALSGKEGVFMDEARQYGLFAVIGLPLLFLAVASVVRRWIKKKADSLNDSVCDQAEQIKDEEA